MRIALDIDVSWICIDFGRQVGNKLALKIDIKSSQKGINENDRAKKPFWSRSGSFLGRLGRQVSLREPKNGRSVGLREAHGTFEIL